MRALGPYADLRNEATLRTNASNGRPSGSFRVFQGREFALEYPDNWRVSVDQNLGTVTVAAPESGLRGTVGYGAIASFAKTPGRIDLMRGTRQLLAQMQHANPALRVSDSSHPMVIDGREALVTTCSSDSPYRGQTEVDLIITVERRKGLFYLILISPESEFVAARPAFDYMISTIRFSP